MADVNFERITDLPFNKSYSEVVTDGDYIYYVGGTVQGTQTLPGYSYRYSEAEGWTVLSASGPLSTCRIIYYNGYFG